MTKTQLRWNAVIIVFEHCLSGKSVFLQSQILPRLSVEAVCVILKQLNQADFIALLSDHYESFPLNLA